jgi:hypothetical protein
MFVLFHPLVQAIRTMLMNRRQVRNQNALLDNNVQYQLMINLLQANSGNNNFKILQQKPGIHWQKEAHERIKL